MKSMKRVLLALGNVPLMLSLAGCPSGYQLDEEKVEFISYDTGVGQRRTPVPLADPASFVVLEHSDYGKDRHSAYYQATPIPGADAPSFKSVGEFFAIDARQAYYARRPILGSDPASFKILKGNWSRDNREVYFQTRSLGVCDLATFELRPENHGQWALDARCAYHREHRLPLRDRASFRILSSSYAKDSFAVYSGAKVIEGADPATFEVLPDTHIGRDRHGCYLMEHPVACRL
ncbi:DKNYY domain-containing protein [Stutzerimonas stutzeri]|uniref:DKNYY domain-containing protein n=1 Tax=Stutzerimonas stutzeri TaxID=316 RepID=UPI0009B7C67D|nr:DKNYY domain-containing protein [Stutzerimonas stutzeri]